ncbi:hypothetical protein B484DRAFT_452315 [Ochromonadaceae sp. CCMP2298]|nr:hypothetical protein B484DRAFT_452315 [Ochromonadaceae sp. CCMP2298]
MLVLRGALVNKGFYLQARAAVVGDVLPTIACAYAGSGAGAGAGVGAVAGAGPVGVFCALSKAYPQLSAVTAFFALYGVVISLLKDLPAEGEASYKLPLLEVKVAAPSAFCAAQGAFTGLMAAAAAATLSTIRTAGATQLARIGITGSLLAMAYRARQQAVAVEAGDAQGVSYYNLLWKFFYACYLLLPLFRI